MVSMPSRAYTSFLPYSSIFTMNMDFKSVNALSGLYLISTLRHLELSQISVIKCVNALSGLYLISTKSKLPYLNEEGFKCQCPLGLIPHFYRR